MCSSDLQSAAGLITTAIDLSDAEIVTALALGSNDITVAGATISSTEFSYLDNVTSAIQTQLNAKLGTGLTSAYIFVGSAGNIATGVAMSGDVTIDNAGATIIGLDKVALGTDTTGNYVATIADSGGATITVANSGTESAAVTLGITADSIGDTQLAFNTGQHLTTSGTPQFARLGLGAAADATNLLTISTATGGTGFTSITRADGAGVADPAQLLLIDNLDIDRVQPIGLVIQSAAEA